MEKAHAAACGTFCGVRHRPKIGVFIQFCTPLSQFLLFLRSFARYRLKNWISVGDWITWLLMYTGTLIHWFTGTLHCYSILVQYTTTGTLVFTPSHLLYVLYTLLHCIHSIGVYV